MGNKIFRSVSDNKTLEMWARQLQQLSILDNFTSAGRNELANFVAIPERVRYSYDSSNNAASETGPTDDTAYDLLSFTLKNIAEADFIIVYSMLNMSSSVATDYLFSGASIAGTNSSLARSYAAVATSNGRAVQMSSMQIATGLAGDVEIKQFYGRDSGSGNIHSQNRELLALIVRLGSAAEIE